MMVASDPNGSDYPYYIMTESRSVNIDLVRGDCEYILLSIPYECELFLILFRLDRNRKGAFTK